MGAEGAKPVVTLLTALPLMWGEGGPAAVLSGASRRSAVVERLERSFAIDTVDMVVPGRLHGVLMVAQPRRLAPSELFDIDQWVRSGGRALVFADSRLDWPSALPLGDPRRAPPVTLLDPLLQHWGLELRDGASGVGRWAPAAGCRQPAPGELDCRIGRGRAILIADADLLDDRRTDADAQAERVEALVRDLSGMPESNLAAVGVGGVAGLAGLGVVLLWWRRQEHKRNLSKTE